MKLRTICSLSLLGQLLLQKFRFCRIVLEGVPAKIPGLSHSRLQQTKAYNSMHVNGSASAGMGGTFLVANGRELGGSAFRYDGLQDCRCFNSLLSTGLQCADNRCLGDVFPDRV